MYTYQCPGINFTLKIQQQFSHLHIATMSSDVQRSQIVLTDHIHQYTQFTAMTNTVLSTIYLQNVPLCETLKLLRYLDIPFVCQCDYCAPMRTLGTRPMWALGLNEDLMRFLARCHKKAMKSGSVRHLSC